jgi:hypothetical protein
MEKRRFPQNGYGSRAAWIYFFQHLCKANTDELSNE